VSRDKPSHLARLHLLNISTTNIHAEHVKDYLAQEGISDATLKAGKRVLFVDTGFSGSIPRQISEYFPATLRPQLQSHLMVSSNSEHPSCRVFLSSINPYAVLLSPSLMAKSIHCCPVRLDKPEAKLV
jgi:hypothetical protein